MIRAVYAFVAIGILMLLFFSLPGMLGVDTFIASGGTTMAANATVDLAESSETTSEFFQIALIVIFCTGIFGGMFWLRSRL